MNKKIKILQFKDLLSHADVVKSARRSISFALDVFNKEKTGVPSVTSYIREIKEVAKALKESENVLADLAMFNHKLIDVSPVGVACYDGISGNCLLANAAIGKILGAYPEEIRKQNFREIVSWEKSGLLEDAEDTLLNGKVHYKEVNITTSFDKNVWIDYRVVKFVNKERPHLLLLINDISKRKLSAAALVESQSNLQAIFENTSEGFILTDTKGIVKAFNNKSKNIILLNVQKEIKTGKSIFDFIHPSRKSNYKDAIAKVLMGEVLQYDYPYTRKNGQIKWYVFTVSPVYTGGEIEGLCITSVDITERKKAEESLLLSQSNLKAIIENTDAVIYSLDKNLRYITFNQRHKVAMKELYGLDVNPGDHVFDFLRKMDNSEATSWHKVYSKALKGQNIIFEKEFNFHNIYSCIRFSIHPIWEDKVVIGLSCFGLDITTKKQAEDELRHSESRYRQIVETAQEGIWLIDENNLTTFVNEKMCDILEYSPDEMIGKENYSFMDDEGRKTALISLERRRKGIKEDFELSLITKSGRKIRVCISANPIFDDDGKYKGALGMVSDITEKKNLEELLDKTNKLARIGSWEIDVIAGSVFWSDITKEIREADPDFVPDLSTGMSYFKEGYHRDTITHRVKECMEKGIPWDEELQIITQKGNLKWIRTIGEATFKDNVCIRIYGSFQDINTRKNAEIEILKAYEEKNIILESIGDAFFAVDKNWVVTYWNHHAETILYGPKTAIIGKNLWEIFSDSIDSESYKRYHHAIESNEVTHFEDYYKALNKWYEISAYPSANGLSVYFKDVTEKKLLEQQLLKEQLNNHKEITKAVVNAQEKERDEIGKELHDNINQLLAASKLYLAHSISKPVIRKKDIVQSQEYITSAMDEIRKLSHVLVGPTQDKTIGLINSLEELVNNMDFLKDIKISFNHSAFHEKDTEVGLKLVIYRIIQGQLSNILKHANASEIDIELNKRKDDLVVIINDNGKGFDTSSKVKGIGLQNISNRAEVYNGVVEIISSPGHGCKMKITFRDRDPVNLQ